jgi:hypothetical protein
MASLQLRTAPVADGVDVEALAKDVAAGLASAEQSNTLWEILQTKEVAAALAVVEEAVTKPICRFDVNYGLGAEAPLPHAREFLHLSKLLAARARLQAGHGDPEAAWRTLMTGLRSSEPLRLDPLVISHLVRISMAEKLLQAAQEVWNVAPPGAEAMAAMNPVLAGCEDSRPFLTMMDGDRLVMGEWAFRNEDHAAMIIADSGEKRESWLRFMFIKPVLQFDHAAYLRLMHEKTRIFTEPFSRVTMDRIQREDEDVPFLFVFTKGLVPMFADLQKRQTSFIALSRIARVAMALLAYRNEHREYPERLDVVREGSPPSLFEDPFTSQPLVYRRDGAGFVLYSVGPDGTDDGGRPKVRGQGIRSKEEPWDVVWRVSK